MSFVPFDQSNVDTVIADIQALPPTQFENTLNLIRADFVGYLRSVFSFDSQVDDGLLAWTEDEKVAFGPLFALSLYPENELTVVIEPTPPAAAQKKCHKKLTFETSYEPTSGKTEFKTTFELSWD